jgi:hypothetical protein
MINPYSKLLKTGEKEGSLMMFGEALKMGAYMGQQAAT